MILNSPTISGSLTVTGNTTLSGSINVVGGLTGTSSFATTAISSSYSTTAISSSYSATSTSSSYALASTSASYALASTSASYALASTSASYGLNALTSSNSMTASSADTLYVRNNATVLGSITAQTLVVQTVTSSVLFSTGSNKLGSLLSNTQELTGSVGITGSLSVVTTGTEFQVNAGGVNIGNALTDSHIISGSVTINPNGLFVSSSGNVGIGTSSPSERLEVNGGALKIVLSSPDPFNSVQNTLILANGAGNGGAGNRISFNVGSATPFIQSLVDGANSNSGAALVFATPSSGTTGTERMRITSAGNVGIGTSSPFSLLNIGTRPGSTNPSLGSIATITNDGLTGIDLGGNVNANNVVGHINWVNYIGVGNYNTARIDVYAENQGNSGALRFWTANVSSSPTERMRITSGGNVGIGTTSPGEKLEVSGTTRISGGGRLYMNTSVMLGMVLQHGDLANGDGSNTTETDAKATNGTAKKRASGASSNTFFYGPYTTLPAGNYVAGFRMKVANNSSSSRIVSIDVSNVTGYSGAGALAPNNFASSDAYQYFKIYFTVANPSAELEFRALSFVSGITDIFLDHILIMPNLMV